MTTNRSTYTTTHVEEAFADMRTFVHSLPELFARGEGEVIYAGRNELRRFDVDGRQVVVKSFAIPNIINQIAYGSLRSSKAQRSCEYARLLLDKGIESPQPVGYTTVRQGLFFRQSYYACLLSTLPYSYIDLMNARLPEADDYLLAIGRTAARLHDEGMIHKDFSRGNILLGKDGQGRVHVEIIDLNRIRFHKISLEEGCRNFERLPASAHMHRLLAQSYAEARGFDVDTCYRLMRQYRLAMPDAGKVVDGID